MDLANWACVGLLICGIILFLYGANFYNAAVGWAGAYLFLIGAIGLLALYIYGELTKKNPQNP